MIDRQWEKPAEMLEGENELHGEKKTGKPIGTPANTHRRKHGNSHGRS